MNDIAVIGLGNSEPDDYLETAAVAQSRAIRPDPEPENGFSCRSDVKLPFDVGCRLPRGAGCQNGARETSSAPRVTE